MLLLGLKPAVLYAYGTWPGFATTFGAAALQPWLDAAPEPVRARLRLDEVAAPRRPRDGVDFGGGAVLWDALSPRAADVAAAFFVDPAPRDLEAAICAALGYPTDGARRNARCALVHVPRSFPGDVDSRALDEFATAPPEAELLEFLCEGPREVPRAAAHALRCRGPVEDVLGGALALSLCGRVLSRARVDALARGEGVDETAAAVAAANRGGAVLERE